MTLDAANAAVVWGLMFVVGLELTGADCRRMLTQPRAVVARTLGPLLLPVAVGMTVRHRWPAWSAQRRSERLALLGLLALLGFVLHDQADLLRVGWRGQVSAALWFTLLAMMAG